MFSKTAKEFHSANSGEIPFDCQATICDRPRRIQPSGCWIVTCLRDGTGNRDAILCFPCPLIDKRSTAECATGGTHFAQKLPNPITVMKPSICVNEIPPQPECRCAGNPGGCFPKLPSGWERARKLGMERSCTVVAFLYIPKDKQLEYWLTNLGC